MILSKNHFEIPQKNLIRFEIETTIGYLRQREINIRAVKNLYDLKILEKLGKMLTETARSIERKIIIPDDAEDYKALKMFYLFQNATKKQLQNFRKHNGSTYYRHQKVYKKLLKKYDTDKLDFSKEVDDKWKELMNS